jgi:hypothetical protein
METIIARVIPKHRARDWKPLLFYCYAYYTGKQYLT